MKLTKRQYLLAAVVLILLAAVAVMFWPRGGETGDETVNLIKNGGFETLDGDLPANWTPGRWFGDEGVSYLELSDDAYEGEHSILVENVEENDARFEQTISVLPNSTYRFSCMVKAEGCDESTNGASISFKDTFTYSDMVYDTHGQWQEVVFYGTTGPKQRELTVMLRVGGYGRLGVGKAWFDDLQVTYVKALPAGAVAESLATNAPAKADTSAEEPAEKNRLPLILLCGALFLALSAMVLLRMNGSQDQRVRRAALVYLTALAIVARAMLAMQVRGYPNDMSCFQAWADRMFSAGPLRFYSDSAFCDYPPGYMLLLWPIGAMRAIFGLTGDNGPAWLVTKLYPILCDGLCALALYRFARKRVGEYVAACLSLLFLFNPACIVDSAMWGQIDSVLTLLLILAVWNASEEKWLRGMLLFTAAILVKPQALLLAPMGMVMAAASVVRAQNKGKTAREVGLALLAAVGAMLLFSLPFALSLRQDPFTFLRARYLASMGNYNYMTINAANLYALMGMNWKAMESSGAWPVVAWTLFGLSYLYSFFLYIKGGERKRIFLCCALLLALVFAFGPKMHERYAFPALALLLFAYAQDKDARLLLAFVTCSLSTYLNTALVLENQHLLSSQGLINGIISCLSVVNALLLSWTGWDLCVRGRAVSMDRVTEKLGDRHTKIYHKLPRNAMRPVLLREDSHLHMRRIDYALMLGITLVYAALAFTDLGSTVAPQTSWTSSISGEQVVFDLGQEQTFHLTYYGGICNSTFTVATSDDGTTWSEEQLAEYDQGQIFKWLWFTPVEQTENGKFTRLESGYPLLTARYVRLTAQKAGLVLSEVGFLDEDGNALPVASVESFGGVEGRAGDPALLADEQNTVPAYPSYYNSMYFDEIYHARTGYEFEHGMTPYETTHPPLGKVLIMLGIHLFGMTPFGWRCMGALVGVLMLPAMYLMIKQLLKKTEYAAVGTFLLAVDAMHFTQTRIATIDSYGVFFIILMYLFMFRYCQMNFYFDDFKKTLIPLGLSGVCMGLGIASKWICIYAGIGLAVLFFYTLIRRYLEYRQAMRSGGSTRAEIAARRHFWAYFFRTGAFCIVFFIVVPVLIYYFSYYWYMKPLGGLSVSGVWQRQINMFNYHKGLSNDTHFFRSPWYEWPLIIKPMWYYSGTAFMPEGVISSISCMGNPAVWWGGLLALLFVIVQLLRGKGDRTCLYLVIAFAAQYLPWVLVPRSTFIYHYFASVPFIIVCITVVMKYLKQRRFKGYKVCLGVFLLAALVLFIGFYPLESGHPVARSYAKYLRWFNWYNY